MRTLYLLRHAKSSWKDEALADFERPLNGRGERACETVGRFLRTEDISFDLVLSSPALRARETIDRVLRAAKLKPDLRYDERIYEATASRLLDVVAQIESDYKVVALVGHNPGMQELLQLMTGEVDDFPTATLAKINLKNLKWSEAGTRKGELDWIVRPKEMEKA